MLEGMTLLDAKEYDPEIERRRKKRIISAVVFVLLVLFLGWWFRFWPEEHVADLFLMPLQNQNYEAAYGIWWHDPQWKQHQTFKYPYNEFYRDWGPGGEWGRRSSHTRFMRRDCLRAGSGVIIDMTVNDRTEPARVWVEKSG